MKYQLVLGLSGLAAVNAHALPRRQPNSNNALSKRGVDISKFTMPDVGSYTKTSGLKESEMRISSSSDYVQVAKDLVKEKFPDLEFRTVDDHYIGKNGIAHVNFKQTVHGIDIDNADFHVNVRDGKVFSHGNSFFTGSLPKDSPLKKRAFADPIDALKGAIDVLGLPIQAGSDAVAQDNFAPGGAPEVYKLSGATGAVSQPEARLVYFRKSNDDDLTLSWRVETDVMDNWLLTYVDADKTSDVLGVVDYVSDLATYEVYPWNINDPTEGEREIIEDPWLISASEFTWQSDGTNYTVTRGNNGIAQVNPTGEEGDYLENYRPDAGEELAFEYPYSLEEADPEKYWDASITQLFYTANQLHDLLYVLGFTEEAGNFEANNNGQGGQGNDFVILNAQDGSGTDNANFATPPDGSNGRMRMYMWTSSEPQRDCSFEAGVVIHEYIHGLSTRLTGGPANSGCLRGGESGGMGEGWSDFFATTIRLKPDDNRETDYPMGAWVSNDPGGIRSYPYSTNTNTNPHTYADIDEVEGVHAIGTIWCTILYEVLWNLIDKHGKNDNDFPTLDGNGLPDDGKFLALKIVQDAMALQPCSPDFIAARDAIIDADEALTGGDNFCELWKGFSKRGLGPNAEANGILGLNLFGRTEDFEVPEGC